MQERSTWTEVPDNEYGLFDFLLVIIWVKNVVEQIGDTDAETPERIEQKNECQD